MSDDTAIDRAGIRHAHQQVADAIVARIAADRYPCKLPRELDLAEEFSVSYPTVRHAMAILRERGLVVSIHGRGTFIAPHDTADAARHAAVTPTSPNSATSPPTMPASRQTPATQELDQPSGARTRPHPARRSPLAMLHPGPL